MCRAPAGETGYQTLYGRKGATPASNDGVWIDYDGIAYQVLDSGLIIPAARLPDLSTTYAPTAHTHAASAIVSEQVALARGGTNADLSATGPGLLIQATTGGAITVGYPGMRNILINGQMSVWQRGTSAVTATAGTNTYRADRWGVLATGGNPSVARSTTVPATGRSIYSLEITGAGGVSACLVSQRIEAINTPRATVTFSAWVRVSSSRAITFRAYTPSAVDNWTTNTERVTQSLGTISANTWTYVSHTFDASSLTNIANGLSVRIDVGNPHVGDITISQNASWSMVRWPRPVRCGNGGVNARCACDITRSSAERVWHQGTRFNLRRPPSADTQTTVVTFNYFKEHACWIFAEVVSSVLTAGNATFLYCTSGAPFGTMYIDA